MDLATQLTHVADSCRVAVSKLKLFFDAVSVVALKDCSVIISIEQALLNL